MPFAPFIYGVVVGSAITYIAKDNPTKKLLKDTSGKVTDGIGALTGKVTSIFKKNEETATADKEDAAAA